MTDWMPIVIAAIGSGALGSVITAYGTQTRERRQARAAAREALRNVEKLTPSSTTREQITAALDAFDTSAMRARLPRKLTALHHEARLRTTWYPDVPDPGDSPQATRYESRQQ